jgi:hypothetical protein
VVSDDFMALRSAGLGLGLGKAKQTEWPFFIRTPLQDVILAFWNAE